MIPQSVVVFAGWFFIFALILGAISFCIAYLWDKLEARWRGIWVRNENTYTLQELRKEIELELKIRGELK